MDTDTLHRREIPTAQKMGMHATLASQQNKLKKIGIHNGKTETATLLVLGEELIAPVFHFNVESLAELAIINNFGIARCAARVGNSIYVFIAPQVGRVEKHTLYPAQKYPEEWSARALELAISDLGEFAKYAGGVNVRFCPQTPSTFHEPIRDKKDVFYFYVFTTPSGGEDEALYPSEMFGESIEVSGGFFPHLKPTHGRGVILSDGKINIAQVVGNNVYLLWDPIVLMGEKMAIGRLVFRKTLAHIFSYLLSDKSKVDEHPDAGASLTEENVRDQLDIFAKAGHSSLLEDLAKREEKIRKKEQELAHMKAEFVFIRRLNNFIIRENLLDGELQNNLLRDRKRILDHKMLTGVRITKHGIEVDTKLIRIAHNQKIYRIGTFTLRFSFHGEISIWTRKTLHPTSVPHPHISAWNGPCFGNADEAIKDAVAEFRYGDAVDYLLDWLENGYTPELVVWNMLEEWPTEEASMEAA